MEEKLKPGDLLFMTQAFHDYVHEKHPNLTVVLTNRIGKLEEIIDWNSPKGKLIKAARIKSGKWVNLPLEENRYIVSIYYHELIGRKGERGVVERGLPIFRYHPVTGVPFFIKVPNWIYKEIMKQCEHFDVELRK